MAKLGIKERVVGLGGNGHVRRCYHESRRRFLSEGNLRSRNAETNPQGTWEKRHPFPFAPSFSSVVLSPFLKAIKKRQSALGLLDGDQFVEVTITGLSTFHPEQRDRLIQRFAAEVSMDESPLSSQTAAPSPSTPVKSRKPSSEVILFSSCEGWS